MLLPWCCKGVAGGFPFWFSPRVWAEAQRALVQWGRRAILRAMRAAAFPLEGSDPGWWLEPASLQHHFLQEPVKSVKSNKEKPPQKPRLSWWEADSVAHELVVFGCKFARVEGLWHP